MSGNSRFLYPPDKQSRSHKPWPLDSAKDWIAVRVVAARTRTSQIIWILSTAPAERLSPAEILELYRLRWQIELLFKRLSSTSIACRRAEARPRDRGCWPAFLPRPWLAQKLLDPDGSLSPWGYAISQTR